MSTTFPGRSAPQSTALPPETDLGIFALRVRDLDQSTRFYTDFLGMQVLQQNGSETLLGAGDRAILRLIAIPNATQPPPNATGLYHAAILLPTRADLARFVRKLTETGYEFGFSDHLVSEAFYLNDAEGNGLEIYRDRPRSEWRWQGGTVAMANAQIDFDSLFGEIGEDERFDKMPDGTKLGHMHLKIGNTSQAEAFYHGLMGFDVTATWSGALFMSAGGYHHHLGLNTWHSRGGNAAPRTATGLHYYEVILPDENSRDQLLDRLASAGVRVAQNEGVVSVNDPWDNEIRLLVRGA